MENYNTFDENIKTVSLYLVSLYYKTNCKYLCSRAKINRLLTIYKFCTIKYNENTLKGEYIINTSMWFPKLTWYIPPQAYSFKIDCEKQECKEITDKFNDYFEIPKIYKTDNQLSNDSRVLLEKIFRKFGNYSLNVLAPMIDEIVLKMPIKETNGKIDIDIVNFEEFLSANMDNEVLNFIKKYKVGKTSIIKEKAKVKKIV